MQDLNAENRKRDHIEMAFKSKLNPDQIDGRFYYEPILSAHPKDNSAIEISFLGKQFKAPIWVSSMTGGTKMARTINLHLAKACKDFGLGMGLGSCRQLLFSDEFLADFNVRKEIGEQPLYINLGIAQIEQLLDNNETWRISELIKKLEADGMIIHVNPLQEWLQPEGDRFKYSPIYTIKKVIDLNLCKVIVKEVGQGMGIKSLEALLSLPIEAIDFGANGGTNFSTLEVMRSTNTMIENYSNLANIGHSADEMVGFVNQLISKNSNLPCKQIIISGGVSDFLDGYYLNQKLNYPSIYGQASGFLKHAIESYESLYEFIDLQIKGYNLANSFLKVK
jgi:isopentenyl-diphosphate delta-isomerase